MAVSWGAWEYSGGNGMRVGIEVTWEAVSHSEPGATATIEIWTENQYTYGDDQTLNYSGSISGSTSFTNNDGGSPVLRATKSYTYNYQAGEYGSSPGSRTFSASLSGAFNGVTPSKSVTSSIPARPIAAPAAPSSVGVSRISDTSTKITWVRNATSGEPYQDITIQRTINEGAYWYTISSSVSGAAVSYTAGTDDNWKIRFQVRANNTAGSSGWAQSPYIYTTPLIPTAPTRADSGSDQLISWTNAGMGYSEYATEIIGYKNGASVGVLGTAASGVTSFTHTTTNPVSAYTSGDRWKYTVRHKTTAGSQGVLYSAQTAFTSETAGVTSPPDAPTGLDPNGGQVDPTVANVFSWTYNPTDSSAQQQFQIRHRLVGAGSWTTETAVSSSAQQWTLPANTYTNGNNVEWQVATKGANATWSPWSSSATVTMFVTKRVPAHLDLGTGTMEADYSGFEWRYVGVGSNPGFQNSWVNYGSATFGDVRFCRRGGVVYVQGLAKSGTVNTTIFTLPVGFRPDVNLLFTAIQSTLNTGAASTGTAHTHVMSQPGGRLTVGADGTITQAGAATSSFQSLCISFPADQ